MNEAEAIALDKSVSGRRTVALCADRVGPRLPGPCNMRLMALIELETFAREAALPASNCCTTGERTSLDLDEVSFGRGRGGQIQRTGDQASWGQARLYPLQLR